LNNLFSEERAFLRKCRKIW